MTRKKPATQKQTPKKPTGKKSTPKKPVSINKQSKKRKDDSGSNDEVEKTTVHLKWEDYLIIINWLSNKQNYNACFGSSKAPAVGRHVKGKINGYEMMAINFRNWLIST